MDVQQIKKDIRKMVYVDPQQAVNLKHDPEPCLVSALSKSVVTFDKNLL